MLDTGHICWLFHLLVYSAGALLHSLFFFFYFISIMFLFLQEEGRRGGFGLIRLVWFGLV